MQIEPQKKFIICRQLDDPLDVDTLYIRAYIRDAFDDSLLDTVDLTDKGDHRFRYSWQVVADGSGQGRYITITTKVFTDSGYTSESDVYGRQENEYLVKVSWNEVFGHGGGADINYKKVRKIIKEELEKIPKDELPEIKETDLTLVLRAIRAIKIPEAQIPDKVDLEPIKNQIQVVKKAIEDIYIPEQEKLDLSPVLGEMEKIKVKEDLKKLFDPIFAEIKKMTNDLQKEFEKTTFITMKQEKPFEEKKEVSTYKEKRKYL